MAQRSPLTEYQSLQHAARSRPLTADETQRLALVRDVLLELGSLPREGDKHPVRPARVVQTLQVTFTSKEAVTQSYSKDIASGGVAITTHQPLTVGEALQLEVHLPDGAQPLRVAGMVIWVRGNTAGVSFGQLGASESSRLKDHLLTDESLLSRVRSALGPRREPSPAMATPLPAPQAPQRPPVDSRPGVLVQLNDTAMVPLILELLDHMGLRGMTERVPGTSAPAIAAVEAGLAQKALSGLPAIPVVCINASGPEALMGWLASREVVGFVKRPASAAAVVEAVRLAMTRPAPER
ncbi:MAG: PilZ domain-containing protein [Myxococcales bacterium]|nr:PilZ domain-containing protein [Myxococcales bacterium]